MNYIILYNINIINPTINPFCQFQAVILSSFPPPRKIRLRPQAHEEVVAGVDSLFAKQDTLQALLVENVGWVGEKHV